MRREPTAVTSPGGQQASADAPNRPSEIFRDPRRGRVTFHDLVKVVIDIYAKNKKSCFILADVVLIIAASFFFKSLLTPDCIQDTDVLLEDVKVYCEPYFPMDHIMVDIDLNTTSHCYSSKSCVALGQSLRQDQGKYKYNFIIGGYGFVYMQHGYSCLSENAKDGLYLRLPVESIHQGQDLMAAHKAMSKFTEILREGLECGLIQKNYTVTAKGCGKYNDWCTQVLSEALTDNYGEHGSNQPRSTYCDTTEPGKFYNPLNLKRVYSYQYKLVMCSKYSGT